MSARACFRCGGPGARWAGDPCSPCRAELAAEAASSTCSCTSCELHLPFGTACTKPAGYYLENFVRAPGHFAWYCKGCGSRRLDTSMFSGPYLAPPS